MAVLAGSAISGPAIVHRVNDRPSDRPAAEAAAAAPRHAKQSAAAVAPEAVRAVPGARRRDLPGSPEGPP